MSDAVVEKVQRKSKLKRLSELDSRSIETEQKDPLKMPPLGESVQHPSTIVTPLDKPLNSEFLAEIAFAEEPIKILIHRSVEKFASSTTDYIAINGTPAEMLFKNGWVPMGYLPRGVSFITKRKYVEVLARAKQDTVNTQVIERDNEDPQNFVERVTTSVMSFTVLEDKNPKGTEWLTRLVRSQA